MQKTLVTILAAAGLIVFAACSKPVALDCSSTYKSLGAKAKSSLSATCPAGCAVAGGSVWGTGPYTTDSSICRAAIHAGVISDAAGGALKVHAKTGQLKYEGSEANGVKTSGWGPYDKSFSVEK
ncbi:MAG: hypothetical protein HY042_07210 [Spirochaetia bacterium]|nr:hypothetical protein [Spirochaetia bacterium]